jgi:hypothetical protein
MQVTTVSPGVSPGPSTPKGEKSWAQKRKDNLLARSGGRPSKEALDSPPNVALGASLKAVAFATKLKKHVNEKKKAAGEETWQERRAARYLATHGGPRTDRTRSLIEDDNPVGASPRSPRSRSASAGQPGQPEKSWTQRRKESYLRKYGFDRAEKVAGPDVAVTALSFVSKLKRRSQVGIKSLIEEPPAPAAARLGASSPRELTWTQKRKEAYLRKYGRQRIEAAAQSDVAVSAVKFASKLKLRVHQSGAHGSGAAPIELT